MTEDRYKYFRVEARSILDDLGQGALDLEKGASTPELVARMLRLAHTLKGAARVVRQPEIARCAHELEDALAHVRQTDGALAADRVDPVIALVDEIGRHVARLAPQPTGPELPGTDPLIPAFRPAMDDLDALLGGVFEAHAQVSALRPRVRQVEQAQRMATVVADQVSRPAAGQISNEKARTMAEDLRGLVGTLERELVSNIDQLDRELQDVRAAAERLRLAPVSALFTFLERAVRDAARALGKRVVFEASGGDVRVDTFVLNVVQGALLHIVRNAVAHGIENGPAERHAAGKPVDGAVVLRVSQRGRLVAFTCTDDGRGIDLEAVRRIAERKGLALDANGPVQADALLRTLLKGGISTSGTVTDLAGRGIGLDVVREAAERLGGDVTARTEAGQGTTIEIVVPLSVASFDALLAEGPGGAIAIPLDAVRGSLRVSPQEIVRVDAREFVLFDGRATPIASLPHERVAGRIPMRSSAIVVQGRAGAAAFYVDRIVGVKEVVMRPLPEGTPASAIVAGATLDAAGDPLLVFDPDGLVAIAAETAAERDDAPAVRASVLVIDDSLTTRMLERSILESAGYDVDLATSGEEALIKAHKATYALFLVDVEMPGMDGFTFIERVRADPALDRVPAILVTSRNAPEDLQRGQDVGADAYVVKSEFDQGALLERIRTLIR